VVGETQLREAPPHLARCFAREGDGKHVLCSGGAGQHAVCNAMREHPGFARSRSGMHNRCRWRTEHCLSLALVEALKQMVGIHGPTLGAACSRPHITMTNVPYSPKSLNEGERIILDLHPHWWDFVPPTALGVAGVVFGFMSSSIATDRSNDFVKLVEWVAVRASWLLVVVCVAWLVKSLLQWSRTHFVVTNHRVIYREGVIARTGVEIPIRRVNNVNFHQSVFERLVGAGDLLIESGGEDGQSRFSNIRDPEQVQNLIQRTLLEYERGTE
jgi:membrane protein YdbS with pleckstrin-like domain